MIDKLKHLEKMADLYRHRMATSTDYETYEKWRSLAIKYLKAARELREEMGYSY